MIQIEDPADPRLADYVSLRDAQLRKSLEAAHGLFVAEGEKVVRRSVASGHQIRSFLMTERWLAGLGDELTMAGDVPCYLVTEEVAEGVTGFHVHRGALASLQRKPLPSLDEALTGARRIVVLEDIVDHANVGAIFRGAAALGMDAILLSPRCADPLYRRSLKVAMGAIFSIPWTRLESWENTPRLLKEAGFLTLALTPRHDAAPLTEVTERYGSRKLCVLLGAEGSGLSSRWMHEADVRVTIPMSRDIDSLNVAAAACVMFYALRQSAQDRSAVQSA